MIAFPKENPGAVSPADCEPISSGLSPPPAGMSPSRHLPILLLVATVAESHRYMGCYKEISQEIRLMKDHLHYFKGTLTPDLCINYCKDKGFKYAGVQDGVECFCSNDRPSFKYFGDPFECNEKCQGVVSKMCGGKWRLSVYDIHNKPVNYIQQNYVGCYADDGAERRALRGEAAPESKHMTPEFCAGYCYNHGYRYSGSQIGRQCFCGNEIKGNKADEGDCDLGCDGDTRLICGGGWRSSVYDSSLVTETHRYMGCYKEISSEARLMLGLQKYNLDTLSPEWCVSFCKYKGFNYAGVQNGAECYCSKERPSFKYFADPLECDVKCRGNNEKICGGEMRLSVYDIHNKQVNYIQPNYIGCYADDGGERRALRDLASPESRDMTPEFCAGFCSSHGFKYSGSQIGRQCFCGTEIKGAKADEGDCDTPCDGDQRLACGGGWRSSVYSTSSSESYRYMGCYKEPSEDVPLMTGHSKIFTENFTPVACVTYCKSKGFNYAGVQISQCFCSNERPSFKHFADPVECNSKCTGDKSKICGGERKLSVYDIHNKHVNHIQVQYVGCYADDEAERRALRDFATPESHDMTPEFCAGFCFSRGYRYSGSQIGRQCFCGNEIKERRVDEGDCYMVCDGDPKLMCGGPWRNSVYDSKKFLTEVGEPLLNSQPSQGTGQSHQHTTESSGIHLEPCAKSRTESGEKTICEGELLFHEKFNSWTPGVWKHEIFMPEGPDYEFVVFEDSRENVFLLNGKLNIKPSIQSDDFVRRGRLHLEKCTRQRFTEECQRIGKTFAILPPVKSARLTTKDSFSFKYGKVVVQARLPAGDWLVPEIWLEPKGEIYGPGYQSGRIKIAQAFGNHDLTYKGQDIGSRRLESGIRLGTDNSIKGRKVSRLNKRRKSWYEDFHNYSLTWTPDRISFQVDNEKEEDLIPANSGKLYTLVGFDPNSGAHWDRGSSLAPFDQEFYISLGVSVGGMTEFPDDSVSTGEHIKPWRNFVVKGLIDFWDDRSNWHPTWNNNKFGLQVEDVKVFAL